MNIENLKKLKKLYDQDPAGALAAEERAAVELEEIMNGEGITKQNQPRAEYLIDLLEFCRTPTGEPSRSGGFAVGSGDLSADERCFRFGEFLQAIAASAMPRGEKIGRFESGVIARELLQPAEFRASGLQEAVPSEGGFLLGADFAGSIFEKVQEYGQLYNRCRKVPLSGNSNKLTWPTVDETSRANGSRYGGIRGYWAAEAATLTSSKPKFGALELIANKVHCLGYSTDELLADAAALGAFMEEAFSNELTFKIEDGIIRGTGAGQPLGIMNSAALVSITGGSSAGTIVSTDVIDMYGRFKASSLYKAVFLANQDCLPQLMRMHSATFGGAGDLIWSPANKAAGQPFDSLFGRPILYMEQCESVGTAGDLILMDPTQYLIVTKGPLQFATSAHVQFLTDSMCYRATFRLDGQPMWSAPLAPYKGAANTQSPYVCISTRS